MNLGPQVKQRSSSAGPSRPGMLRRVLPLPAQALLQQGGRSRSQTLPHPSKEKTQQQQQQQQQNGAIRQISPLHFQSHQNHQFLSLTPQQKHSFFHQVCFFYRMSLKNVTLKMFYLSKKNLIAGYNKTNNFRGLFWDIFLGHPIISNTLFN